MTETPENNRGIVGKSPSGFMKLLLRLPIYVYRVGLGWLMSSHFMLLNHIGRKSGLARQTVVEVVHHNLESDTYIIASGWGYTAQWYQNLLAHPEISIQVGGRKLNVKAEVLSPEEGAAMLLDYRQHFPTAARGLSRVMGIDISTATAEQLQESIRQNLPLLALHPR